jgi:hypothetical protein
VHTWAWQAQAAPELSQLRETVALMKANEKALMLKLKACDAEEKALSAQIADLVSMLGLQRGAYVCGCRRRTKAKVCLAQDVFPVRTLACMRFCELLNA